LTLALLFGIGTLAGAATLKVGLDADPVSLDPHVQLSGGMLQYSHWVFDPLVRYAQDMSIEPRLATRWERIDELTMRFFLREGVKFHSGNTFSAKDVKFTLERLKKSVDFKGLFELFTEAQIVDQYTIDIKTKKPYALLLRMCTYIFPMDSEFYTGTDAAGQPKDAIVKIGPSFALANESGTGPLHGGRTGTGGKTGSGSLCRLLGHCLPGQRGPAGAGPHQGRRHTCSRAALR
jgi:peptide/nickel transport system substrate-binding protein